MRKAFIIPTSAAEHLALKQSRFQQDAAGQAKRILTKPKPGARANLGAGGFEVIFPSLNKEGKRYFPDGEIYMRILKADKLKGKRVIVLHSGAPRPNEGLVELELILQILKDHQIEPEIFFIYFLYGMQDKVFETGETNAAENLIKKLISYYKVKKIYIIDPHFGGREWVKKYPLINVSAVPVLIQKAKKDFGENILFLSPDIGGKRRTKISGFKKKRLNSFNVEMLSPKLNLKGKIVAVIDDMIKTGGTLLKFYEIAKKSGAKKVLALITHGVIPSGVLKIKKRYSKLYLTNTINRKEANIDMTDLILKTLSQ